MLPFEELSPRGQAGRLRALAGNALEQYGLGDARVSLLKQTFNTLFRVVDDQGRKTALRVGAAERIHPPETEAVETAWLAALRRDTDIAVPLPFVNASGASVTIARAPGVPEARTCVLFEWARGRRLGEAMSSDNARAAGTLLARLHEHGAGFDGGRPQPILVADNWRGFELDDRVPRNDPVYGTLFAEAIERAQPAIDGLWARPPHPPHLLHGDFHTNNIFVWRGRLTPLDFQDLLWGFEIQDVAISIMGLERFADADELAGAMRAGYEAVRPWPADDTDTLSALIAARHLSVLNLGCNLRRPGFDAFVVRHGTWLERWLATAG